MKRLSKSGILFFCFLLTGILLMAYPALSNEWNKLCASKAVADYQKAVSGIPEEEIRQYMADARAFDALLDSKTDSYALTAGETEQYHALLNAEGNGVMGYIEIPDIGVRLPIYHGTDESVLQIGVGHLEWTSLPIGGEGTHCVLSGHTGLPSARLFSDIDELEEGDVFYLNILRKTLTYEVDQIRVVLPGEISDLLPEAGKDYCTLITCTPYGINTHRLLVRGHRVRSRKAETDHPADHSRAVKIVSVILVMVVLCLLFCLIRLRRRKKGH